MGGGKKGKEKRKRIEGGDIQRVERMKMGNVGILGVVKKIK